MDSINECRAEMIRRAGFRKETRWSLYLAVGFVVYFVALAVLLSALGIELNG